jgi:hypothetical protein
MTDPLKPPHHAGLIRLAATLALLAASPVAAKSCMDGTPMQAGTSARAIDAAGHFLFIADTPTIGCWRSR